MLSLDTLDHLGPPAAPPRRIAAPERVTATAVLAIVAASWVGALRLHPTASPVADVLWSVLGNAAIVLVGRWCPRVLLAVAGVAGVVLLPWPWLVVVAASTIVVIAYGQRRDVRAAGVAGLAVALLSSRPAGGAIAAAALLCVVVAGGVLAAGRPWRRRLLLIGGLGVVALGAAVGWAGWLAVGQRSVLVSGVDHATDGLDAVRRVEPAAASEALALAHRELASVNHTLGRWPFGAVRFVPVVGQHVDAARRLLADTSTLTASASRATASLGSGSLLPTGGSVDLDRLRAVGVDVHAAAADAQRLAATVQAVRSPWLLPAVDHRLGSLADDLDRAMGSIDTAAQAADLAPAMLGGAAPRRWFVAIDTPSEARGLGGYMGNYAVLTADRGKLSMSEFGRTADLELAGADPKQRKVTGPPGFLDRYGRFGAANGPNGTTTPDFWANVTMAPDFPTVAQVVSELYPQSGGAAVDGVISLDPSVLAALLRLTGPVSVAGVDQPLDADNVEEFLLRGQYERYTANVARVDVLEHVARTVLDRVLGGIDVDTNALVNAFRSPIQRGRLSVWSKMPAEEALLARAGVDGAFPQPPAGSDVLAVVGQNASGSKIDVFGQRAITYEVADDGSGEREGTVTVELRNDAPSTGLPDYLIGNVVGEPPGSSRQYVSVYTRLRLRGASLDDESLAVESAKELGYHVYSTYVTVPSKGVRTLVLDLVGPSLGAEAPIVLRAQPMARPDQFTISVNERNRYVGEAPAATLNVSSSSRSR